MLRVTGSGADGDSSGILFIVPKDEGGAKPQLQVRIRLLLELALLNFAQISIPKPIADACDLRNNCEVNVTKVILVMCIVDSHSLS